jgi:hypothetical protein
MEIYKLHMDGNTMVADKVAETISIFIHSFHMVEDFFIAGLPCQLIWQSSQLTNKKILDVVDPIPPCDSVSLKPHHFGCPITFTGSASLITKYQNIPAIFSAPQTLFTVCPHPQVHSHLCLHHPFQFLHLPTSFQLEAVASLKL